MILLRMERATTKGNIHTVNIHGFAKKFLSLFIGSLHFFLYPDNKEVQLFAREQIDVWKSEKGYKSICTLLYISSS